MSNAQRHSGEDEWAGLMARAQEGDAAAYRHLLAAIAPYLRALAARYHRAPQDVEDYTYDPGRPFKPCRGDRGQRTLGFGSLAVRAISCAPGRARPQSSH